MDKRHHQQPIIAKTEQDRDRDSLLPHRRFPVAFSPLPVAPRFVPLLAALLGGAAGALVGWVIAESMRHRQFFTHPTQPLLVSIALIAVWILIGVISGLTVLAPEEANEG